MAYRDVIKIGDEILRKKCKEVKKFDEDLWILLDDMAESMYKTRGVGLAGPQIGVLKRIVVVDVNNMFLELINPAITHSEGSQVGEEGCLSVPNKRGIVDRPMVVTVAAQDRFGNKFTITGENLLARCLCHECDHLDGILYVDKMIEEIKE